MRNLILSFLALSLLLISCSKEEQSSSYATDDFVPEGWVTENQTIVINEKLYEITVAGDPNGDGIKFLNSPFEVEEFFRIYEETLIPHIVIGKETKVIYYYKDEIDLNKHFSISDNTQTKSYLGATLTVFQHGTSSFYGYGNAQQNQNNVWQSNWHLPTSTLGTNGVGAYGKSICNVGSVLNDEISVVSFYMNNADESITFVGYLDAFSVGSYCLNPTVTNANKAVVITKLPAAKPNGTWIGSNSIGLWTVKRKLIKNWNDCISGYQFFQNSNIHISNVYVP